MTEYRPCLICHGTNPGECSACGGMGRFPFPWRLPEDARGHRRWTIDEIEVVNGASTATEAYARYCSIYGDYERSLSSVRHRWRKNCGTSYCWTIDEIEVVNGAPTATEAVELYIESWGTERTPRAIADRWRRLRVQHK